MNCVAVTIWWPYARTTLYMASWLIGDQFHYSMSWQEDAHLAGGWISVVRLDGCSTIRRILEETENQRTSVEQASSGKRPYVVFWVCAEFVTPKVYTIMEGLFVTLSLWRLFSEIWWRPCLCISDAQRKNNSSTKKQRHPTKPSESTKKKYLITISFKQTHTHTHILQKQMEYTCWMFGVFFVEQRFFLQNDHERRFIGMMTTITVKLFFLGKMWEQWRTRGFVLKLSF